MVDIYETKDFDNFICSVVKTYVIPDILDYEGKLDDTRLKLVLSEFPTYSCLATREVIGKFLNLYKQSTMCVKQTMQADAIVRLLEIRVYFRYLDGYMKYVTEVGGTFLHIKSGILTIYAVGEKENTRQLTIFEIYMNRNTYERYIAMQCLAQSAKRHQLQYPVLTDMIDERIQLIDHYTTHVSRHYPNFV